MKINLNKWEKIYGVTKESEKVGVRFANVIAAAHEKTGQKVVILVDEYDEPMFDAMSKKKLDDCWFAMATPTYLIRSSTAARQTSRR